MHRTLVIDASFALRSVLPGPLRTRVKEMLAGWGRSGDTIWVPALWHYETTSALCKGVHFKDITQEQAVAALGMIAEIEVDIILPDAAQIQKAFEWTLRLRRAAAYDSFYLAVAETTSEGLWTADERLYNATQALAPWVHWAGESLPQ